MTARVSDVGTGERGLEKTRLRISELEQRGQEIAERNRQLAQQEPGRGSTPEDVRRAAEHAEQARAKAIAAHTCAAMALLRSAAAHEAAAGRHEALAAAGFADREEHQRRARQHREMAAADRRAAGGV